MAEFVVLLTQVHCVHNLSMHFLGYTDWAALSTMAVWFLEESHCTQSQHSKTCCTSQVLKALNFVDQELLKASGLHVLCSLIAAITNVGQPDLTLESSLHPIVSVAE